MEIRQTRTLNLQILKRRNLKLKQQTIIDKTNNKNDDEEKKELTEESTARKRNSAYDPERNSIIAQKLGLFVNVDDIDSGNFDQHLKNVIKKLMIKNSNTKLSRYKIINTEDVIKILQKDVKYRLDVENRMVGDYLSKNFTYFGDLKKLSISRYIKLIRVLTLEVYEANSIIINYDEILDKFYVVFEGNVIIFRPKYILKEMELCEFCDYLIELKKKDPKKLRRTIEKNAYLDFNFYNLMNNDVKVDEKRYVYKFTLEEEEECGLFGRGFVFGERYLIRKKKKYDNVYKSFEGRTTLISVSKFDFNRILRTLEEKKLENEAEVFREKFPMFKIWPMEQLITLFNYCTTEYFNKDDFIFKQNEENYEIFFVEEGKIEQFTNVSFSWVKNFMEYIGSMKNNLIEKLIVTNPKTLGELTIMYNKQENIIFSEKINFPLLSNITQNQIEIYERNHTKNNIITIKENEEILNDDKKIFKIPVMTTDLPKILGIEDAFELKYRFTSVKCLSGQIKCKRIKVFDLLRIFNNTRAKNLAEYFLEIAIQKKMRLIEIIKLKLKNDAFTYERNLKMRYNDLCNQEIDKENKTVTSMKLHGWDNGNYFDDLLDTPLHLNKTESKKRIKQKKLIKNGIIHNILKDKNDKRIHNCKTVINTDLIPRNNSNYNTLTNLFNITTNANNEFDTLTNFQKTFCRNDNTKNNFSENSTASGKNSFSKKIKNYLKSDLNRYDEKFSLTNRNSNMKKKIISMSTDRKIPLIPKIFDMNFLKKSKEMKSHELTNTNIFGNDYDGNNKIREETESSKTLSNSTGERKRRLGYLTINYKNLYKSLDKNKVFFKGSDFNRKMKENGFLIQSFKSPLFKLKKK